MIKTTDSKLIIDEILDNNKKKKFAIWIINNVRFLERKDKIDYYGFYGQDLNYLYEIDEIVDIYKKELFAKFKINKNNGNGR